MFNIEFDHGNENLVEACGFDHEYFSALLNSIKKIYEDSIKTSFFVEAAESQMIGNSDIPSNIRIAVRILLIMVATYNKSSDSSSVKRIVLKPGFEGFEDFIKGLSEALDEIVPEEIIKKLHKKKRSSKKTKKEEE